MEQRVRRLTPAAGRPTVPPPPDLTLGIWMVSMGFRLRPLSLRLHLLVRTPHRAILPWARYRRIDPLGLDQKARWTDLLLVTGLTGQLRKGQLGTGHTGHRVLVTLVTGYTSQTRRTGHIGQIGYTGHTGYTGRTGHTSQKALEVQDTHLLDRSPRRIDPLGLDQNARWTDPLLVTGLTGQLRIGQPGRVTPVTGYW